MAYRHHTGVFDPKFKQNSNRRELEELMSEWYGSRFAALEITKRTEEARPLADSLDEVIDRYLTGSSMKNFALQENWQQIIGPPLNQFTALAAVKENKVFVEVKHPAFLMELRKKNNDQAVLKKITQACPELEITEIVFVPAGQYRPD